LLGQLNRIFQNKKNQSDHIASFTQIFSENNDRNLEMVRALKNISSAHEAHKLDLQGLVANQKSDQLRKRFMVLFDDLSQNMNDQDWNYLSQVIYEGNSPIQKWATVGLDQDLRVLLDIIKHPTFREDVIFLK